MDIPGELRLVREATAGLLVDVADLDDEGLAAQSSLVGWSRADVLIHLTADARQRANKPAVGQRGGRAGDSGSGDPPEVVREQASAASVVADLASASEYLADTWAVRAPDAWSRRLDHMRRGPSRVTSEPAARLVEVAVHHVDLDIGQAPEDWPAEVVDVALVHVMTTLAQRHARVGGEAATWRLSRTDGPNPADWLVMRAPYGTEIHPVSGDAEATVSGPGHFLLAWVLARRPLNHSVLTVEGDAELAASFPAGYPY